MPACCAQQNRGYYRFPAISGNTIAFTSEGDLWEIGADGGIARRLTTHPGEETRAAFSPDGKTIAYSANYEGPTEIYTMPAVGGLPTRRTFEGGNAQVVGWTPDGKILYTTRRYSTLPDSQLATIDSENRIERVPLSQASQGVYEPNGRVLYFTRLPFQGSQAKRYQGGTAQNIWKFTAGQEAVPLTADHPGTSKDAMWWNGRVYFLTDRDGTMNLWSMDANGQESETAHAASRLGHPSRLRSRKAGSSTSWAPTCTCYDIASGADKTLHIELPSDFDHLREHWIKTPLDYTTAMHISPDGNSVVATSRGRVFVIPAKNGRFVDVTEHKPGRYRDARMLPDGKSLLVLSTETGETEFWKLPANGVGQSEALIPVAKYCVGMASHRPTENGSLTKTRTTSCGCWMSQLRRKRKSAFPNTATIQARSSTRCVGPQTVVGCCSTAQPPNGFSQIMLYNVETGNVDTAHHRSI